MFPVAGMVSLGTNLPAALLVPACWEPSRINATVAEAHGIVGLYVHRTAPVPGLQRGGHTTKHYFLGARKRNKVDHSNTPVIVLELPPLPSPFGLRCG